VNKSAFHPKNASVLFLQLQEHRNKTMKLPIPQENVPKSWCNPDRISKRHNLAWPNTKTTWHKQKPTPSKQIVDLLTAALCWRYL
jgi:hypothetical protein